MTETLIDKKVDLPTFDKLGVTKPKVSPEEAKEIGTKWVNEFARNVASNNIDGILASVTDDCWWRDILALTWDLRTFQAKDSIKKFLKDRLKQGNVKDIKVTITNYDDLYPDLAWVRVHFAFENTAGGGIGVARLVPTKTSSGGVVWKAYNVALTLDSLRGHPPATGPLRDFDPNHGKWLEKRRKEMEFADREPEVLIVGGGQSGLEVAARLKLLGVSTLVCEKQARIGDNWRHRYAALCLHDVVCASLAHSRHCRSNSDTRHAQGTITCRTSRSRRAGLYTLLRRR